MQTFLFLRPCAFLFTKFIKASRYNTFYQPTIGILYNYLNILISCCLRKFEKLCDMLVLVDEIICKCIIESHVAFEVFLHIPSQIFKLYVLIGT